jgi:hypothetical protein
MRVQVLNPFNLELGSHAIAQLGKSGFYQFAREESYRSETLRNPYQTLAFKNNFSDTELIRLLGVCDQGRTLEFLNDLVSRLFSCTEREIFVDSFCHRWKWFGRLLPERVFLIKNASREIKWKMLQHGNLTKCTIQQYRRRRYGRYAGANIEIS